ncbi:MAG: DUF2259 domain-containing protein [Spirochaetales bacterium]|nr:DUF2259 domain-containing protein [Spirochaetales bacterium]
MKKIFLIITAMCLTTLAFAGDVASFKNLGFSEDSKYFLFSEYGISEKGDVYTNVFCVDVAKNSFVKDGIYRYKFTRTAVSGLSPEGAMLNALRNISTNIAKWTINHAVVGRMIYVKADDGDTLNMNFRDFSEKKEYEYELVPSVEKKNGKTVSSFYLNLTITDGDGSMVQYKVGNPNYKREGVLGYSVAQVIKSPDCKSLVFVIEKKEIDGDGFSIRYMVETVKLK